MLEYLKSLLNQKVQVVTVQTAGKAPIKMRLKAFKIHIK